MFVWALVAGRGANDGMRRDFSRVLMEGIFMMMEEVYHEGNV